VAVKVTANFERNLIGIRGFLANEGAEEAFDALVEDLETRLFPNLQRFPDLGADFMARAPLSREGLVLFDRVASMAGEGSVRQIVEGDYVLPYLARGGAIFMLAIKHHRQLSFDLAAHWP
jgi:plasmid stabilization system protein ParE